MAKPNRKVKPGTPHPTKKGLVMGKNGSYVSKTTYAKQVKAANAATNTGNPQQPIRGTSGKPTQMGSNNWPKGTERFTEKPSGKGGALVKAGSSAITKPNNQGGALARTGQRALPGSNPKALPPGKLGGALKIAGQGNRALGMAGAALGAIDAAKKVFNPKDNMVTNVRDLVASIKNKGQVGPGHSRFIGPVDTPQRSNKGGGGQGNRSVASNPNRGGGGSRTPNKPTAAQIEALTAPGGIFNRPGSGGGGSKPADKNSGGTVKGSGKSGNTAANKPAPKPRKKPVPSAKETYRDGGKGLYQGSKAYRAALAKKNGGQSSGNPLLDRFRKDMGRNAATGEKPTSKPASKRGSNASSTFANNRLAIDNKKGGQFNTRGLYGDKKDKKKKK